jgi:hypothetical protein
VLTTLSKSPVPASDINTTTFDTEATRQSKRKLHQQQ